MDHDQERHRTDTLGESCLASAGNAAWLQLHLRQLSLQNFLNFSSLEDEDELRYYKLLQQFPGQKHCLQSF